MVKIIDRFGQKRRIACHECDSILEYDQSDIKMCSTSINEYEHYIICPVCCFRIIVD